MIHLSDLQKAFNRAFTYSCNLEKCFFTFASLLLCGLFFVFFQGIALHAPEWVSQGLRFFSLFLSTGIMLAAGILLIRTYHNAIKNREVSYRELVLNSWELLIRATYLVIPLICSYLILWVSLGIYLLLSKAPALGPLFNVIFSFIPFLLNFGALSLLVLSFILLFFLTPIFALKGGITYKVFNRSQKDF